MNLADLIEKRRFVGREFLLWVWFESEIREGRVEVEGFGPCEIFLEGQITLAQLRDALQTSRKYAQAYLEHFDAARLTLRRGDAHVLRKRRPRT